MKYFNFLFKKKTENLWFVFSNIFIYKNDIKVNKGEFSLRLSLCEDVIPPPMEDAVLKSFSFCF